MYKLKTGTVNDVDEIWQVIEQTWLDSRTSGEERRALINLLNITHSIGKIKAEILNNYQRYVLVVEDGSAVAFASYSSTGIHEPSFKIHKIYNIPSVQGKGYNKILIRYIEELASNRGSKQLSVHVAENEKRIYFEALGFLAKEKSQTNHKSEQQGIEMIKIL